MKSVKLICVENFFKILTISCIRILTTSLRHASNYVVVSGDHTECSIELLNSLFQRFVAEWNILEEEKRRKKEEEASLFRYQPINCEDGFNSFIALHLLVLLIVCYCLLLF